MVVVTRRRFIGLACLFIATLVGSTGCSSWWADEPARPPRVQRQTPRSGTRIVFFLADDMGYGDLTSYGAKDVRCPNIDKLAKQGVRFTQFYANGAECTPTRTAFLTGRYPQRVKGLECAIGTGNVGRYGDAIALAEQGQLGLQTRETVIPWALRRRGYLSAAFGKWHLGYDPQFNPIRHGFDRFFGVMGGNCDYFTHKELSPFPVLYTNEKPVKRHGYMTKLLGDDAVSFIHHNYKERFFLYVPFTAPHFPFQAPDDEFKIFNKDNWLEGSRETYARMIESMDTQIGRVLRKLDEKGIADETIVIFASDHGAIEPGSNAPFRGKKSGLFEGGIRAPLIVRWPGKLKPGTVSDQPCMTFDLTASMIKAAGSQPMDSRPLDGMDILGHVQQGKANVKRDLFWRAKRGDRVWRAIRSGDSKYITKLEHGKTEQWLFDLAADPGEKNNLLEKNPAERQRLEALLAKWEADVDAPPFDLSDPAGDIGEPNEKDPVEPRSDPAKAN